LVVEVVEQRPIHRIPHRTNQLLLGLANIRGELDLCVSLSALLGIEVGGKGDSPHDHGEQKGTVPFSAPAASQGRLLVTEHAADRWVFPVDQVEGVRRVPANVLENLPQTVQKSPRYYSQALFRDADRHIGVLSADRLYRALESVGR
jgi:chemotaxis-related protein WspD